MTTIYVAKRPFKSAGEFYPAGSVINNPAKVKLLKNKIREGKVVLLTPNDDHLDSTISYIENRAEGDVRKKIMGALKPEGKPRPAKPATVQTKPTAAKKTK